MGRGKGNLGDGGTVADQGCRPSRFALDVTGSQIARKLAEGLGAENASMLEAPRERKGWVLNMSGGGWQSVWEEKERGHMTE